jgi:hypothetical protein
MTSTKEKKRWWSKYILSAAIITPYPHKDKINSAMRWAALKRVMGSQHVRDGNLNVLATENYPFDRRSPSLVY